MIFVVVLVAALILGIITWRFIESYDNLVLYMAACTLIVILIIVGIVLGINFFSGLLNYEANCAEYATIREVYIDELNHYDEMRDTDVTASSIYFELREKVVNFNHNVNFAKQHDNIWFRYAITDPAYTTVDTIELGVG